MTVTPNTDQAQVPDDKSAQLEKNFAAQRKHYEKQLEQERNARMLAEEKVAEAGRMAERRSTSNDEEDDDSEPYVDNKKLNRKLASFERNIEEKIDKKAEAKAYAMIEQERRNAYLKDNADMSKVLSEENLEKFANTHPRLAESLLRMPEGFERQRLVYENIKALGVDRPEVKTPSVQEKIEANRKSPYYQGSGVGSAPYASQSDFSEGGQKNAYAKMQELKNRLRI